MSEVDFGWSSAGPLVQPCFMCGYPIPRDDFLFTDQTPHGRYAVCGRCGIPNSKDDTSFVGPERLWPPELPPSTTDVFGLVGGGWRATCDCGRTEAVSTQAAGWEWVLDHDCTEMF